MKTKYVCHGPINSHAIFLLIGWWEQNFICKKLQLGERKKSFIALINAIIYIYIYMRFFSSTTSIRLLMTITGIAISKYKSEMAQKT